MDKTREEFEDWVNQYYEGQVTLKTSENGDYKAEMHTYTINSPYIMESKYVSNTMNIQIHDLWEAYKSRDEEIKECIKKYDKILSDYNLKKAEIFLLKRNFKEAQKQKTIMRNIINLRDKEIRELKRH